MDTDFHTKKRFYQICTSFMILTILFIIADIIIGMSLGGNLNAIPQSAEGRILQFHQNPWLGLYYLDFLNAVNQLLFLPGFFALTIALYQKDKLLTIFSLILFLVGSTIFVAGNNALSMLEISRRYFLTSDVLQKTTYLAAAEMLINSGAHGSPGVFFAFVLPNIAGALISISMIRTGIFSKLTGYLGLVGSVLLLAYLVLVTFIPDMKTTAMILSMPGGLMLLAWMIMFTLKMLKLSKLN